jgi:hypothetical protein
MADLFGRFRKPGSSIGGPAPLPRKDAKASDSDIRRMTGSSGPVGGPYRADHHEKLGDHRQAGHHQARGHQSPLGGGAPARNNLQKREEAKDRAQSPRR